ncbi:transaldolase [Rhodocytophaga rosea]|uniref:Transaldolase n=1 Tax=Rhodocytophaga rosea TaxID=2704465 RepID=A0A6C0GK39_9BACT|nr:transaldolase [Rhodocytophaga rosea]QHT68000.1 transaldolase [Rhodocytophaga rosea]
MKVGIAADHGGFDVKQKLVASLQAEGYSVTDFGAHQYDKNDDYPDLILPLAQAVSNGQVDRGIAVCGSGVGASIVANKVPGVRSALITETYSARQGVEHDDMNIMCIGGRVIGEMLVQELVKAFLQAAYTGEERHQRRLSKVIALEKKQTNNPMTSNPLVKVHSFGQSIWMDFIRRGILANGELKDMIDSYGLKGITSNPAIFEEAINRSTDYQQAIQELVRAGKSTDEIYQTLAVEDIQNAADLFRPIYDQTNAMDGYVSLEVSPYLAKDTDGTIAEAKLLWKAVNRPNVMIKVPGTLEGLPAIQYLISEGINVNVTLLFGLERYRAVTNAYITGLENRLRSGKPIDKISSVASFFLSRIDVMIDPQLEKIAASGGENAAKAKSLLGKIAIANAKMSYQIYKEVFNEPRFKTLADRGAQVQRLLWASTGTKNPAYSDVMYIETLIGPDTVNTVPLETLKAYQDHGQPASRLEEGLTESRKMLSDLDSLGINLDEITHNLEVEGVDKFNKPFAKLMEALENKRKEALSTVK